MAPSNFIAPRGGYNFGGLDYLGPITNLAEVIGYDRNDGSKTAWWSIHNTDRKFKLDTIAEYSSGVGVTIDGTLIKDGALRITNATWITARNAANSGNLNILAADASDNTVLNAANGKAIALQINGSSQWVLDASGLAPSASGTETLGNASAFISTAFTLKLHVGLGTSTGDILIALANGASAPSGDPASGFFIYSEGNVLKARGSSGTITTLAVA